MNRLATLYSTCCSTCRRFCADESGATAIEYALVAGGIGAAIAVVVQNLGSNVKSALYDKLAAAVQ